MSADGEIELQVNAEGVDEAEADLSNMAAEGDGDGGPPDGGGRNGGISQALAGGLVGGLVSQLLGPLLDVLDPILKILNAFLAPVAALLLRLLSPVLRQLVQLLPAWNAFVQDVPELISDGVDFIQSLPGRIGSFLLDLPGMIWGAIKAGASWITDGATGIGEAVWSKIKDGAGWLTSSLGTIASAIGGFVFSFFKAGLDWLVSLPATLASRIASALEPLLPGELTGDAGGGSDASDLTIKGLIGGALDDASGGAARALEDLRDTILAGRSDRTPREQLIIGGGLEPFVESVERDPNVNP